MRGVCLGKESAKERKMMVRFRCGNEERKHRYWTEGEERKCYEERERELSIMWNGCSEMRERDRKEQREILIEDRMDERDAEKQGVGDKKKFFFFWYCYFFRYNCMQESESP
jgi:hypothetical protein